MNQKTIVYISSWTHGEGEAGLGVYELDQTTGALTLLQRVDTAVSFNVTRIDCRRSVLYALNEGMKLPGMRAGGGGQIYVYKIDPSSGMLSFLGKKPTLCPNPSYITLDATGSFAVVANHGSSAAATKLEQDAFGKYCMKIVYDDSGVELFEVLEDGMIGELLDFDKHYGNGPEPRQLIARPHSAVMSPDGRLFAVCDKGNDTVSLYQLDRENKKLLLPQGAKKCKAESLPRYCVFHPTQPYFYHNNEKYMKMCAYKYNNAGVLTEIGECSALPAGYEYSGGKLEQQGLCIHPNGKYIYDIVRGPNVIAVYQVNDEDGAIELVQSITINDSWPRGCAISPDGHFLLVCGLDGGKVFVYSVDNDGIPKETGAVYVQPFSAYVSMWTFSG